MGAMDETTVPAADAVARRPESVVPPALAVLAALLLQLALPDKLVIGPKWLLPALEGALLLALLLGVRVRHHRESIRVRLLAVTLIGVTNVANAISLGLLIHYLLQGGKANGAQLLISSVAIWATNVLIFALWYWEIDRGGPGARLRVHQQPAEFLYPQMINPRVAPRGWRPTFFDYLYVSLTNATAFSPTDTMPLSHRVKGLMSLQAVVSLLTLALVAARAVNILA